jgi:hypothetical protein
VVERPRSNRPLYHRLLRLERHRPGPVVTFLCFEGSIGAAMVLAFAEVLPWLSVVAVPLAIAGVVKLHDLVVAATPERSPRSVGGVVRPRAIGVSRVLAIARPGSVSRSGAVRGVAPVPRVPPR